jgi:hypothetical protein
MELGFQYVASGPLVRSSYHAAEAFVAARVQAGAPAALLDSGNLPPAPANPGDGLTAPGDPTLLPAHSLVRKSVSRA